MYTVLVGEELEVDSYACRKSVVGFIQYILFKTIQYTHTYTQHRYTQT